MAEIITTRHITRACYPSGHATHHRAHRTAWRRVRCAASPSPRPRALRATSLALVCAGLVAGCGGGGWGGVGDGDGDGSSPTHTLGGRVDGLSGAGLVLVNNGGNNLAVQSAGAFQFRLPLPHGANYNVSVQTQPAGQACAVANGTGVANATVTNVVVTCGAPLTLQSSTAAPDATGVDRAAALSLGFSAPVDVASVAGNITLSRAGQAVPITAAGSGSAVTVHPQAPLMPLARYTLAAATGLRGAGGQRLGTAASIHFTTRDGAWQGVQAIEASDFEAGEPQIAVDAGGNALAVWYQDDGTRFGIWANRYAAGAGWGTPVRLTSDGARHAAVPQIAVDADGSALAVWRQSDGTVNSIWANRYTAGAGWGAATSIESDSGDAREPQIAVDARGNALAVWVQEEGTRTVVRANRYVAGTGWGTAARIDGSDTSHAEMPQIGIDADGNALVVWSQPAGGRDSIWANRFTAGAGWGAAALVESDDEGNASSPQLAVDASGHAMAVWEQSDGERYRIRVSRYTAGAGWGAAATIDHDDARDAERPQIAVGPGGHALATWRQFDGTRYNVWARHFTADAGWGAAALIEAAEGDPGTPRIAIDINGNALAVWEHATGARKDIWSNRYTAGVGWGTPALIETDNAGSAHYPQLVVNAKGNALAVWQQFDGARTNIVANRFQ